MSDYEKRIEKKTVHYIGNSPADESEGAPVVDILVATAKGIPVPMGFVNISQNEISEATKTLSSSGTKHDQNKPDLALLPSEFNAGVARAFMDGERKYGRYNYLKGMDWTRLIAAAKRHIDAFQDGEDIAEDSKLNHLWHAGACIAILSVYYERKLGTDNRYKK